MMKSASGLKVRTKEYRQKGYWGDASLADFWAMSVLCAPDKTAVVDNHGQSFTYRQADHRAGQIASYLQEKGIGSGDFVSFQLPGWAEFFLIYIACLKLGAVANPLLPSYRPQELLHILNKCQSKILFIPAEFRQYQYPPTMPDLMLSVPSLASYVIVDKHHETYPDSQRSMLLSSIFNQYPPLSAGPRRSGGNDLAAVLFTSGTESFPKGVMLTHNNIIFSERAFAAALNISYLDVMLMPAPVAHATGFLHGIILPFMFAAKCVLQDQFKAAESLALIEREKCTFSMGATPFVFDILQQLKIAPRDISSLRFFLCGGAPIPRKLIQEALDSGFKILSCYGSTESVPHTVVRPDDPLSTMIFSDGRAVEGVDVRIVDKNRCALPDNAEGEELSRGPNVFVGYLKEPELTEKVLDKDGWFYSGDICTRDKQGYIKIIGRSKDIIIRGGENISSSEIENILFDHPDISDSAVVGMPDQRLGERSCAFVVLKKPESTLTLKDIQCFFQHKRIARYKHPERIEIVTALPRTASGKVKKFMLRQALKEKVLKEKERQEKVVNEE